MHFEGRLWQFTAGVRGRIAGSAAIGLLAAALGVARLALLGWLIGRVFAGDTLAQLAWPALAVGGVILARGLAEHWRTVIAHVTAAQVQTTVRRRLFDHIMALGPSYVARERSGDVTLTLVDGVEQLETYFGQYLPQLTVSLLTPLLIFVAVAWVDLPVAAILFAAAMVALFAPALWTSFDSKRSLERRDAYGAFASEMLDSIQGLATLKAFGQARARADLLADKARDLQRTTMWVLAGNSLARGITDGAIAIGAAAALTVGAWRVVDGAMGLTELLIILMLGTEVFRPMRDLRSVLHQGMVGLSAAKGLYRLLDGTPEVTAGAAAPAEIAPTLAFENVDFSYPGSPRAVHRGLGFTVAAGERIGVVGPSGCGKSSIVRLLLRFHDPQCGRVLLGGHDLRDLTFDAIRRQIAVVSQDTYLFHGTVEENLRMGAPEASQEQLIAAARAANIHDFIAGLPAGYQTVVGEKGIKLSGGQRQRVAIARALLRDAPILVLDEALSAVDAENEAVIQSALDRLMVGRTVLVLAHRLSSVIGCDRIIALDGGRVAEAGSHQDLMAQDGVYRRLMAEQAREAPVGDAGAPAPVARPAATAETVADVPGGAVAAPTEGVVAAEGMTWARVVRVLMGLIWPWRGALGLTFVFGVGRVLAYVGVGICSALTIFALKNGTPFEGYLWALAALAPLAGLLHWFESWIAHDMAFRLLAEMRIAYFRKLDQLAPAYLVRRRTGDLMAIATHDIELVEYFFAHTVAPAFVALVAPAAILAVLASYSPWLAGVLLPFLVIVGCSPLLFRKRVDRLGARAREAAGELGAHAVDSVQGLGEIIAFQQETARGDAFDRLGAAHVRLRLPFFNELTWQQTSLEVMTGFGALAVAVTGGWLAAHGAVDSGILPLLTLLALAAFLPVSEIAQIGRQLADTLGSTRRVYSIQAEHVAVTDGAGVAGDGRAAALALNGVDFSYPGTARKALAGVSFAVPAGQTTALVGTSGAGKTTSAQLLMRFWDPDAGRITLDGQDVRDYQLDDLRARIALVAQDTYLFNDTLRANIMIAKPEASGAELAAAVDNAALGDLVAALPQGLETPVGERGASLSGGQRQRVAIARAFLKDAPVLILDEATSHLDAVNEAAVRQALERLKTARTTIVIAHRLSTVRDADQIVVLEAGRMVEYGDHDTLLAAGGLYTQLVRHQVAAGQAAAE